MTHSPDDYPYSTAQQIKGLARINELLTLTVQRLGKGRSEWLEESGLRRGVGTILNKATDGILYHEISRQLLRKISNIIMKPGTSAFYGDSPELFAEFLTIAEGCLDGIPLHLKGQSGESNYDQMSLDELKAHRSQIDALIEERSIDLEAIEPTNVLVNALLVLAEEQAKMTRSQLAQATIGSQLYAQLLVGVEDLTVEQVQPLVIFCGLDASLIVSLHRSCIARNSAKNNPSNIL